MADYNDLRIGIKFDFDGKGLDKAQKGISDIEKRLATTARLADATADSFQNLSRKMAIGGAAILGTLGAAISKYSSAVGQTEQASQNWLDMTKQIENTYIRIGRVAASELAPEIKQVSDLADKIADFAERNPDVIRGIATIGATLSAGAALLGGLSLAASGLAKYTSLAAQGGAVGGATRGIGTVTLYASAVILGAGIGSAIGNAIGRARWGDEWREQGIGDAAVTARRIGALPGLALGAGANALGLTGVANWIGETNTALDDFTKRLFGVETSANNAAAALANTNRQSESLEIYAAQQAEADVARAAEQARLLEYAQYEQRQTDILRQYGEQRVALEEQTEQARNDAALSYAEQSAQAEAAYYAQRAQAAESYGIETQRMEEDHQREMERMRLEHLRRSADLIASRDALGLVRESRDYKDQRSEAEREYNIMAQRRDQDYARQMAQMEAAFVQQEAQRAAAYAKQLESIDKNYEEQSKRLEKNLKEQQDAAQNAYVNRLIQQGQHFEGLKAIGERWYPYLEQQFSNFLAGIDSSILAAAQGLPYAEPIEASSGGSDPYTQMARGGYARHGRYMLGEQGREFVMNNRTTKAAERMIGKSLNQNNLLDAIMGGGSTINVNLGAGGVTIKTMKDMLKQHDLQLFRELAGAF
jgi:hypothetical protein